MTTKKSVLKAIRQNCLDCMGDYVAEVKECNVGTAIGQPCPLYPYRMGTDPEPSRKGDASRFHHVEEGSLRKNGTNGGIPDEKAHIPLKKKL